jgi:DNA-directed RNA polymerase specialized sigma24 family protein
MAYGAKTFFVDQTGHPFSDRLQAVLRVLKPRLLRQFPSLRDDVVITEILEEAGRRIVEHERHAGAIEKLRGYAWMAIRHVAMSRLRRASMRLEQQTLDAVDSLAAIADLTTERASPVAIERGLFLAEVLGLVSAEQRRVCIWKKCGYSSREIAWYRGYSAEAVDTMFFRAKQKIRDALGLKAGQSARPAGTDPKK